MNINETLLKITNLFKEQLKLLNTINQAFFSNEDHLMTTINNTKYVIPSFISLENKINYLQAAFDNLVNSPKTGEAWFNMDGNSRAIQVRGYQAAPNPINLTLPSSFGVESLSDLKDMMTPSPYINIDLSAAPDDITRADVKKIAIYNSSLRSWIEGKTKESEGKLTYGDLKRYMDSVTPALVKGTDYDEYDKIYTIPVRSMTCAGTYTVTELNADTITPDIQENITVTIKEDTKCTMADGVTTRNLKTGDRMTNYDGTCMMEITEVNSLSKQLTLRVLNGEYVNIIPTSSNDAQPADYSLLRFYSPEDFDKDKYIHVPLEEDQYIYVVVAPMNNRMNTRAEWGTGIYLDVDTLINEADPSTNFRKYYNKNVKNIGDSLTEIASVGPAAITKFSSGEYNILTTTKPDLTSDTLTVIQINSHLNDSESVQNIRTLYKQKQEYEAQLNTISDSISAIQSELSSISFDDMSGTRSMYEAQLSNLRKQQTTIETSINHVIDDIATAANEATIPIEDSKFRIRGYLDVKKFIAKVGLEDVSEDNIMAIQVRYRYKNPDSPQAKVQSINDFVFSEWNEYDPEPRSKNISYGNGTYAITFPDMDQKNELIQSDNNPKFNQIDIPITQGELVDIKARVVWEYGFPYATVASDWSDIITVEFPDELKKNVSVLSIIEENNSEIEANRFKNILADSGITAHVSASIQDQDITYFHKPEDIASGFYTAERRVIPLSDKLRSLDTDITSIQDTISGAETSNIKVTFTLDNISNIIEENVKNTVIAPAFSTIKDIGTAVGSKSVYISNGVAYAIGLLSMTNQSKHTMRIFPMIYGDINTDLKNITYFPSNLIGNMRGNIFDKDHPGMPLVYIDPDKTDKNKYTSINQKARQLLYFFIKNPYDGSPLSCVDYTPESLPMANNNINVELNKIYCFPLMSTKNAISLASGYYKELASGESLAIPMMVCYKLAADDLQDTDKDGKVITVTALSTIYNTVGFGIRTSAYADPAYYEFTIQASYNPSASDALNNAKVSTTDLTKYNVIVK